MNNALLACTVGDTAWLKRCLSSRFDPSTTDKEVKPQLLALSPGPSDCLSLQGLTCLHLAAKNGHFDCLRLLLDSCRLDADEPDATSGRTALHFSACNKCRLQTGLQITKLLLERGANPNRSK